MPPFIQLGLTTASVLSPEVEAIAVLQEAVRAAQSHPNCRVIVTVPDDNNWIYTCTHTLTQHPIGQFSVCLAGDDTSLVCAVTHRNHKPDPLIDGFLHLVRIRIHLDLQAQGPEPLSGRHAISVLNSCPLVVSTQLLGWPGARAVAFDPEPDSI